MRKVNLLLPKQNSFNPQRPANVPLKFHWFYASVYYTATTKNLTSSAVLLNSFLLRKKTKPTNWHWYSSRKSTKIIYSFNKGFIFKWLCTLLVKYPSFSTVWNYTMTLLQSTYYHVEWYIQNFLILKEIFILSLNLLLWFGSNFAERFNELEILVCCELYNKKEKIVSTVIIVHVHSISLNVLV